MLDADAVINNSSQIVGGSNAYPDPAPKKWMGPDPEKHRPTGSTSLGLGLLWLITTVKHNSRQGRWALTLQEMDIRTNYIKGKNQMAEAVSPTPNTYE